MIRYSEYAADSAEGVLAEYDLGIESAPDVVAYLLADLMHYCEREGVNFYNATQAAHHKFDADLSQ